MTGAGTGSVAAGAGVGTGEAGSVLAGLTGSSAAVGRGGDSVFTSGTLVVTGEVVAGGGVLIAATAAIA